MSAPPTVSTATSRDHRVDAIRGVAIVAVVFGHVVRGLMAAGLVTSSSALGLASERVVYFFHLPLFAFVTGAFMGASVEKSGRWNWLRKREWQLLWPFLVWTVIMGVFSVATSRLKNTPTTWSDVVTLWRPLGHLWYLPWLMLATVAVVLARPWRPGALRWVGMTLLAVASLAAWGRAPGNTLVDGMALLVFLALGGWVGARRLTTALDTVGTTRLVIGGVALTAAGVALGLFTPAVAPTVASLVPITPAGVALGVLCSAALSAGVLALTAGAATAARLAGPLSLLGRESLAIYLAHILATAGTRIALELVGVSQVTVHVLLGTVLGVAAPLLLVVITRRVPWLFAAPRVRQLTTGGGAARR
ncbi:acyltransferase family protein [Aestuariimicrobium ganziense]|uniref:acyltransferase family protein n=1 Tax=Aestuariimicrobium ganziense TaxID=2773677 RepID=UPI0019453B1C|nr:acyltransferase [Aestuariimicrobium ganziense]